jgi:hypothetical protein
VKIFKKTSLIAAACAVLIIGGVIMLPDQEEPVSIEETDGWRKVLAFDVMATNKSFKADLGNHHLVVAQYDFPSGWDINVYAYPRKEDSVNQLYWGENTHGPQPWHSFALGKRKGFYPDVRIIPYGSADNALKIVLVDCETIKIHDDVMFSKGRIVVFHKP